MSLASQIKESYEGFHLRKATQLFMEIAQVGNVYFDGKKPWVAAKDPVTRPEMETAIFCCLEALKILALVSFPVIPAISQKLWALLGFSHPLDQENWEAVLQHKLQPKSPLPPPELLLQKVDEAWIQEEIDLLSVATKK
jgi:methionyl-tRNA synthetase